VGLKALEKSLPLYRCNGNADRLHKLRKENKRLKMEREILKKAAAFFANEMS